MGNKITVIHVFNRRSKNGTPYRLVIAVIDIAGEQFLRKFAIFGNAKIEVPPSQAEPTDEELASVL